MATKKVSQATPKTKRLGPSAVELMTAPQRAVLAVQAAELMAGEAAERKLAGQKSGGRGHTKPYPPKGGKVKREPETVAKAAKAAGAGQNQVEAMKAVKAKAPEIFKAVQAGEMKTVADAEPVASLTIGETPPALGIAREAAEVAPVASIPTVVEAAPAIPVIEELAISSLRLDGGTQSRAALSTTTIAEYAESMTASAVFPPIVVYWDGRTRWVADGFHRVGAHVKLGRDRITCDVRQGSQRDAILYSVGANASHGLRRSTLDKKRAVELLLADAKWSKKSDRWIAEAAGVGHPFVAKLRPQVESDSTSQPETRLGRDGKQQPATKPKRAASDKSEHEEPSVTPEPAALPVTGLDLDTAADEGWALQQIAMAFERIESLWMPGVRCDLYIAALKASEQRARDHFGANLKEVANG